MLDSTVRARIATVAVLATATGIGATGTADALPDKQFPVQVTCGGMPTQYVSPMLGADAIWLVNGAGLLQRYAITYADDYLDGALLMARRYGVKVGYGEPLTCTHIAQWPGIGTITGTLVLALAPASG